MSLETFFGKGTFCRIQNRVVTILHSLRADRWHFLSRTLLIDVAGTDRRASSAQRKIALAVERAILNIIHFGLSTAEVGGQRVLEEARWRDHQRRGTTIGEAFARRRKRMVRGCSCGTRRCPPEHHRNGYEIDFCGGRREVKRLCDIYRATVLGMGIALPCCRHRPEHFMPQACGSIRSASHACP